MYLPNINRVCASSPGRALKKKPSTGSSNNSNGVNARRNQDVPSGACGRCRTCTIQTNTNEDNATVNIADETCGKVFPKIVLANTGFKSGGKNAPTVIANQLTGHRK